MSYEEEDTYMTCGTPVQGPVGRVRGDGRDGGDACEEEETCMSYEEEDTYMSGA
jgi:hypothetical protein